MKAVSQSRPRSRGPAPGGGRPAAYAVTVRARADAVLLLAAAADGWDLAVDTPDAGRRARLTVFCRTRAEAERRRAQIAAWLPAADRARAPRLRAVAPQDWAERWKRHFRARRVSDRIAVKPSWVSRVPRGAACVVELDPGLSFGTGLHPTTRACLQALDAWQRRLGGGPVLDAGCGSGILAIAAAKLGYGPVLAIDDDPAAVRAARANAARNGLARRVRVLRADAAAYRVPGPCRVVVANLLAGLIRRCGRRLMAAVSRRPPGVLVLSGILESEYAGVRRYCAARGFRERQVWREGGWATGCFARAAGRSIHSGGGDGSYASSRAPSANPGRQPGAAGHRGAT